MLYAVAAAGICLILGLLTTGGAIAAAAVGSAVWEAGGWGWAAPLLFFVLSSALLGGGKSERRNFRQVLANGGPAAIAAILYIRTPQEPLLAAYVASLAAATADTWATEIGTRFGSRPVRITTLRPAIKGRSGAVTLVGLGGALLGAAALTATSTLRLATLAAIGFAACLIDSVLGDTVQALYKRPDGVVGEAPYGTLVKGVRWIDNDVVNLLATLCAAVAGYFLAS